VAKVDGARLGSMTSLSQYARYSPQRRRRRRHRPELGLLEEFEPLVVDVFAGLAVDVLAGAFAVGLGDPGVGGDAVAVREDGAFAVGAGAAGGHALIRSR
jgi:hypothetical protein